MKVKELIEQLKECDPEKEIEFSFCPIIKKESVDDSFDVACNIELMGGTYPTIMYQDKVDEDYSFMIQFSPTGIRGITTSYSY